MPLVGCKQKEGQNASSSSSGAAAPEASVMIPNVDGSRVSVDQYKGKVVLVNFWATWCEPCKTEIPWLIEFNHKYGPKGLVILGVAMDDDGKKVVEPWVKMQRFDVKGTQDPMDYPILLGNDKIADKFGGILGLPTEHALFPRWPKNQNHRRPDQLRRPDENLGSRTLRLPLYSDMLRNGLMGAANAALLIYRGTRARVELPLETAPRMTYHRPLTGTTPFS